MEVLIIGGGIGGLTLALSLHQAGIPCSVFESAPEMRPIGVGINLLPHGTRELAELGLEGELARVGVETRELFYCNRFGQAIYRDPRGRHAGYPWPQFSMHRGDLQRVLLDAVHERLGAGSVRLGRECIGLEQDGRGVTAHFRDGSSARGDALIGCDGVHSVVRAMLHPNEGAPNHQGIYMWRGLTRCKPFLSGASMVIGGWLASGKIVIYPIRDGVDGEGNQLVNWVAEIQAPRKKSADGTEDWNWNRSGNLVDVLPWFASWRFDWLDVPDLLRRAELILECPMVDRDPLSHWTRGRVTLLGDAAHPMYPRGSNGAGQSILDARALAGAFKRESSPEAALVEYEMVRLKSANDVVIANRSMAPDTILRQVYERTGDRPFERIEDVISVDEIRAISENYKRLAGFERQTLARRASWV